MAMYKNAVDTRMLREREDERYERYQHYNITFHEDDSSITNFTTPPEETIRSRSCGFCYEICLCIPLENRKRKLSSPYDAVGAKRQKFHWKEYADLVVKKFKDLTRSANIVHSI